MPRVLVALRPKLLVQGLRPEWEAKQDRDNPGDVFHGAMLHQWRRFDRAVANSYREEIPSSRAALPPMILFLSLALNLETLLMNPTGSSTPMS